MRWLWYRLFGFPHVHEWSEWTSPGGYYPWWSIARHCDCGAMESLRYLQWQEPDYSQAELVKEGRTR